MPAQQWREALRLQGVLEPYEEDLLGYYASLVSHVLPGAWSVDFMWARRPKSGDGPRWWLIDMALAEDSWHPEHR